MKNPIDLIFVVLVLAVYAGVPIGLVWGWCRWVDAKDRWSFVSVCSLLAFSLATCSALLAVWSILWAKAINGFPFYDPRLLRMFRWGGMLSISGVAVSLAGLWRKNALRWFAPACAAGTLLFWLVSAAGE